ncbi:MAG: hypothetical protein ACK47B_07350 [Armatimonadota bacterium]
MIKSRMRSYALAGAAVLAATGIARAAVDAEPIPADYLQQLAPIALQLFQDQFPNPPVKVTANLEKVSGYHVMQQVGVVVMPDKNLTADAVAKSAEKEAPAAIVVARGLTFKNKDKAVPAERIANADLGQAKLPVYFFAVKGEGEERSLLIYSKDAEPIATAPMKKRETAGTDQFELKLANVDLEKKTAELKVGVGGTHETTLNLEVQKVEPLQ